MHTHQPARIAYNQTLFVILVFAITAAAVSAQARNASASPRSIAVVTEPNSTVWIDGVRYGVTDEKGRLAISGVTAGAHSVRVRSNGFS
ncbi:MAG: hypothetical protein ABJB34_00620, partial [Acidobacteriota bacterium]